jgi:hypothetical protein
MLRPAEFNKYHGMNRAFLAFSTHFFHVPRWYPGGGRKLSDAPRKELTHDQG